MQSFITLLLTCSVSMSVISFIWIGLLPVLSKRYEAKWLYRICLLLMIGWMIPFRPAIDLSFITVQIPDYASVPVQVEKQIADITAMVLPAAREMAEEAVSTPFWWVIPAIWLAGASVYMVTLGLRHRRLTKLINRWSEPVTDAKVLGIAERLRQELKIRQLIDLKISPSITSPMLMGLRKPSIVLPSTDIPYDELELILKHEFFHFIRRDLWGKICIMLATALHWFNPVMYLLAKATSVQCEISCDALVLRGADLQQRKRYGEAMIGVARNSFKLRTAFSTNFYGGKKGMKSRIVSIMDTTKKKTGMTILLAVLIIMIGTGAVFAASSSKKAQGTRTTNESSEDKQVINSIIGPTKTKQVINVDVKSLEIGEFVAVEGPFTLEEGDIIQYDLQGEGRGHLNAGLRKTADPSDDKGYLGASGLTGNRFKDTASFKVNASWAGTYYLWIGNFDGKSLDKKNSSGVLENITGTVKIVVDEGAKRQQQEGKSSKSLAAPVEGGRITTRDGQNLSITLRGNGYNDFAELPFQKGETFTLSVTSKEERELEIGLLSISTDQEYGEFVKTGTGKVSITIPEDGDYRIYIRNHASDTADFKLELSKAIEGPIA